MHRKTTLNYLPTENVECQPERMPCIYWNIFIAKWMRFELHHLIFRYIVTMKYLITFRLKNFIRTRRERESISNSNNS